MTDQSPSAGSAGTQEPDRRRGGKHCRGRGRAAFFVVLALLIAGAAGGFVSKAFSFGPSHWHGAGMMGGTVDPAELDSHVTRMVKHLAVEVDATKEQQEKLTQIATAAAKDMLPLREQMWAGREQARALLSQPTIDRAAIEKLRAEKMATMDAISKRASQAIADAAEVLSPEQRKELLDRFPPFGGHHGPRPNRG